VIRKTLDIRYHLQTRKENLTIKVSIAAENPIKLPERFAPLRIQVYEYLRDSIIKGRLKVGEMYSEQQISSILKMSKTPVREALLQLNREGLVEYFPNRGIKVKPIEDNDVREIFEIRCVLESFVVESLTKRDLGEVIERAGALLEIQKKAMRENDRFGWISINVLFHMLLVNAIGNSRIASAIERFTCDIQRIELEVLCKSHTNRMQEIFEEHKKIVDALKKRDAEAAKTAVINHLKVSENILLTARSKGNM
jgi:DNA-binding GntR family transcriptional regulator